MNLKKIEKIHAVGKKKNCKQENYTGRENPKEEASSPLR